MNPSNWLKQLIDDIKRRGYNRSRELVIADRRKSYYRELPDGRTPYDDDNGSL